LKFVCTAALYPYSGRCVAKLMKAISCHQLCLFKSDAHRPEENRLTDSGFGLILKGFRFRMGDQSLQETEKSTQLLFQKILKVKSLFCSEHMLGKSCVACSLTFWQVPLRSALQFGPSIARYFQGPDSSYWNRLILNAEWISRGSIARIGLLTRNLSGQPL
jgi:hypothetical protein